MQNSKVSVAICTFNGAAYIEQQIKSIIDQTRQVDEIVIGDDGSTDDTLKIAEKILLKSDIQYKIIQNNENLGYRKNFEKVIKYTSGDIIFLCDQDDIWIKNKVEIMLRHFENNPRCMLVFSDAYIVDNNLNKRDISLWESMYYKKKSKKLGGLDLLLSGCYVTGAAAAIHRRLYEKAYPFSEIWYHDAWLAVLGAIYGDIEEEPQKLIMYRQHGNNQVGVEYDKGLRNWIRQKKSIIHRGAKWQKNVYFTNVKKYNELLNKIKNDASPQKIEKIRCAMKFNESMGKLTKKHKWKSIKIIISNFLCGNYKYFTKKSCGVMFGDILFLFID